MDNTPNINAQNNTPSFINPRNVIISSIVLLIAAFAIFSSLSNSNNSSSTQNSTQNTTIKKSLAPHTIVYGVWDGKGSEIRTFDLNNEKQTLLAKLPINIKKVTVLSSDQLLYINDTNEQDNGKEIAIYSISTKKSTSLLKATDGFGIDDYVLSPNKTYISLWEVAQNKDSGALVDGRSRVYSASISNGQIKYLIYDEAALPGSPVHYPRAILNDGTIFTDKFVPNDGAGWSYGMSKSDLTGSAKQDITSMQNGTYSTQPLLSPDSRYLAFAGYDGSFGVGTSVVNGFRQAVITPNTVELLDTQTLTRLRLPKITASDIYSSIEWADANNLVFTVISKTPTANGSYSYNLGSQNLTMLNSANAIADAMSSSLLLTGVQDTSDSTLGNLGESYESLFTSFSVLDNATRKETVLPITGRMMQYITSTPSNYFTASLTDEEKSRQNLQILAFYLKPSLEPQRTEQQSSRAGLPKCREYTTQQCNSLLGTSYQAPDRNKTDPSWSEEFQACFATQKKKNNVGGAVCSDSPLFLYGPQGTKIDVTIHTPVFNSTPEYKNGYNVTLGKNGSMQINGYEYNKIAYDYKSALRLIRPPQTGEIVKTENLNATLNDMAQKLGLNTNETQSLIEYGSTIDSPFVFVSFFDQKTSQAILPITFFPKPDTYYNFVFYFKELYSAPQFSVQPIVYPEKIVKRGVSAIEVSAIFD